MSRQEHFEMHTYYLDLQDIPIYMYQLSGMKKRKLRKEIFQTDGDEELNDWDRYCLEEYEALMADDQEEEPEDMLVTLNALNSFI